MKKIWFGYWFKNWFFLYKIGYAVVISGIRSYFKNHQYIGQNRIPKNAGIIYAVNHQNAFLDPIVIAGKTKEPTHFLTRADIFKKPLVARILSKLYMLPIYRQRDGVNTIKMNEKTFNQCFDLLSKNGNLIIFPEGNHHYKKSLRPFKKGIARIALGAAEKYNYKIPLFIVPLGIDYGNHFSMNGDLLLNAGEPIDISKYFEKYINEPAETINKLSSYVFEQLKSLMISIDDLDNYDSIYYLVHKIPLEKKYNSIAERFEKKQLRLKKIEILKQVNSNEYDDLIAKANHLKDFTKKSNIKPYLMNNEPKNALVLVLAYLFMLFLSPIHLLGLLTNYIPYKAPVWFVNNKVKDQHFHGSLKLALGVIFFFIYWLIILIPITVTKGWFLACGALVLLPIIAIFNFRYWIFYIKLNGAWNFRSAFKQDHYKSHLEDFKKIKSLID